MRIIITIDDVMVEVDDESPSPTLDGIESVLTRTINAALYLYEKTIDTNTANAIRDDDLG